MALRMAVAMRTLARRGIVRRVSGKGQHARLSTTGRIIDLRSDTVTRPCEGMRKAMASSRVGDDVYGEDPVVNDLQLRAAKLFGKEAAVFVPSGTQGNLTALAAQCRRGDEIIVGADSHIFFYEAGGASAFLGVAMKQLENAPDGSLCIDAIRAAVREDDAHFPTTSLVALENTHNRRGGALLPDAALAATRALCDEYGLRLHIDGARIWNAAVATGRSLAALAEPADTLSVCLSKGLGAPVGSVVVGPASTLKRVHRARKGLGGGMRQAGILAAAGIYALEENFERLAVDHRNARALANGLSSIQGVSVDLDAVQTNIVFVDVDESVAGILGDALVEGMGAKGVLCSGGYAGGSRFRMVTHRDVDEADVETAVDVARSIIQAV